MQYVSQYRKIYECNNDGKDLSLSTSVHICIKYHFFIGKKVSHERKEFTIGDIFKVARQPLIKEQDMSLNIVIKAQYLISLYN